MDTFFKKIGKYKYTERHCLGQGSFGKVYEGTDESGRRVAIKKIQQRMIANDSYLKQSLTTEIAIMKKLKHRNIVQLIDTVLTANSIYLILQFCKDGDLKRYAMNKKFTQEQALQILKQLIQGFFVMVKEGIIHRDLKPANVLVHQGVFKICDFGFAKYFGEMNRMSKTCVGTPIYMSPQVLKQRPYTSKSDIWSLGVMYYQMLFGKIPFIGKSEDQIFKVITRGKLTIPKCTQESYLFLKNTLVIQEQERWDWNKLFEHFGLKENKQKLGFYDNLVKLVKGNSQQSVDRKVNQNNSLPFQKREERVMSIKDRIDIRYSNQIGSPQKNSDYQPKTKQNRLPKNILAHDQPPVLLQQKMKVMEPFRNQEVKVNERIYTFEQSQKLRWMYSTAINFLLKQSLYMKIPSYALFSNSLLTYTLGQYVKQMSPGNWNQYSKIKKLVMEQQRQTLQKLLLEFKRFQQCIDIRSIASIIELEAKTILGKEDLVKLQQLTTFYI